MNTKKQALETLLPFGRVATRQWLLSKGLGRHTIDNALKSKKIQSLATGVFARSGITPSWQEIISSLQKMSEEKIYIGGLTAIELQGFGHYLSGPNLKTVHLYSNKKPPNWLWKINCGTEFKWHGTKLLWDEHLNESIKTRSVDTDIPLDLSKPERAIMELLMHVPKDISFDHANEIMQGMTSLSPNKVKKLLSLCRNVKVKRLFLWLADKQGYSWSKNIDIDSLELGSGKRVIAKGGKLDSKYLITVPKHLYGK